MSQGIKYHYTLREEVQGQQAVDSPEWMLPLPILQQLAARENLQLVLKLNFHDYYQSKLGGQFFSFCNTFVASARVSHDLSMSEAWRDASDLWLQYMLYLHV